MPRPRTQDVTPDAEGRRGATNRAPLVRAVLGVLWGGIGGFISLQGMFVGVAATALGVVLLIRRGDSGRSATMGGFLLGIGVVVAYTLAPALTNHDPAVTYQSSTVPMFVLGVVVAVLGAVTLITLATTG